MSSQVKSWQEKLHGCQYHIKTLIGDALLTAASVCYLGPMDQERREQLLHDWKTVCRGKTEDDDNDVDECMPQSNADNKSTYTKASVAVATQHFPVRNDFNLKEILSRKEEMYTWRYSGLSVNSRALDNALTMRAVCDKASRHWPLLVDTDLQSYQWVKSFHQSTANEGQKLLTKYRNKCNGRFIRVICDGDFFFLAYAIVCTHESTQNHEVTYQSYILSRIYLITYA